MKNKEELLKSLIILDSVCRVEKKSQSISIDLDAPINSRNHKAIIDCLDGYAWKQLKEYASSIIIEL